MNVLMVQPNPYIAHLLKTGLQPHLTMLASAHSCVAAQELLAARRFDLILLAPIMPDGDALTLQRLWRDEGMSVPVLALDQPFSVEALLRRMKALAMQQTRAAPRYLTHGDIELNLRNRQVTVDDQQVALTPREVALLEVLMLNRHQFLSRAQLMQKLWPARDSGDDGVLATHLSLLRSRIEAITGTALVVRDAGKGYRLAPPL